MANKAAILIVWTLGNLLRGRGRPSAILSIEGFPVNGVGSTGSFVFDCPTVELRLPG